MEIVKPDRDGIRIAAESLQRGQIVAFPTDTVYGLGVDALNEDALERLSRLKKRPPDQPFLLNVAHREQLEPLVTVMPSEAIALIDRFWPGPLSLLLPARDGLPRAIVGPAGQVCVRVPASRVARDLCESFSRPITSTSANLSGQPPAETIDQCDMPGVAVGIDGGSITKTTPSTIYDPVNRRIVREGAVSRHDLELD